jgi:hypothetical protein
MNGVPPTFRDGQPGKTKKSKERDQSVPPPVTFDDLGGLPAKVRQALGGKSPVVSRAVYADHHARGMNQISARFENSQGFVDRGLWVSLDMFENLVAKNEIERTVFKREMQNVAFWIIGPHDLGGRNPEDGTKMFGMTDR